MNRNQIAAYDDMRASGKAATQRDQIKAFLAKARAPLLRDEIAGRLGMLPSSVCGRLAELREDGEVVEDGARLNPVSGVVCTCYRLARPSDARVDQSDLFSEGPA